MRFSEKLVLEEKGIFGEIFRKIASGEEGGCSVRFSKKLVLMTCTIIVNDVLISYIFKKKAAGFTIKRMKKERHLRRD